MKIVPKINYEHANVPTNRTIKYHKAHQKLGHAGEDTTQATASGLVAKARQKNINKVDI